MTKRSKAPASLEALTRQREELEGRLGGVKADLTEQEKHIEDLAYLVATETDGDARALAAAEDKAGSLRAQIRQLEAGIRGTLNREEAARALLQAEERREAQAKLEAIMDEVTTLSPTLQGRIDELAGVVIRLTKLETEGLAIARSLGITLRPRGTKRFVKDLLFERFAGGIIPDLPRQRLPWVRQAEQALQAPWKSRA